MINANSKSHSYFVIRNLFQNLINRPGYRGILKQVQDDGVGVRSGRVRGFTLVELTLVIAIFIILFGTGAVALGNFISGQALHTAENYLSQSLREARSFSVAQYYDSQWGVYLDTVTEPDRLVLFRGNSYPIRDASFDQVIPFHKSITFKQISLASGLHEIVFDKRTGQTGDYGTITFGTDDDEVLLLVNALGIIVSDQ